MSAIVYHIIRLSLPMLCHIDRGCLIVLINIMIRVLFVIAFFSRIILLVVLFYFSPCCIARMYMYIQVRVFFLPTTDKGLDSGQCQGC